jgi:hypothetical protein
MLDIRLQLATLGFGAGIIFMAWTGITWAQQPAPPTPGPAGASGGSGGRGRGGGFRPSDPIDFNDHTGFTQIFDGATLTNWDGKPGVWRVEDGAIVGESTRENPAGNTFIIYRGAEARDFDLKLEMKVEIGGGSGIQYRSSVGPPQNAVGGRAGAAGASGSAGRAGGVPNDPRWVMIGPQMDFWLPATGNSRIYTGQLYSQNNSRGILSWRGEVTQLLPGKLPRLVGNIGDREELGGYQKVADWNQLTMIVRGGMFLHILNGQLVAAMVDDDPASSNNVSGLIGLQIEGTPCKVFFRNIWLRKIS